MTSKEKEGSSPKLLKSPSKHQQAVTPIVGMGGSAGGLEAFKAFFRHMPRDSGMAFVLVSHLAPDHDSLLAEIMQTVTTMPVIEAQDQMQVAPNNVYVIPPNRDMLISQGKLQLSVSEGPHATRMPIDNFLCSLSEDQGTHAIGIILSGTGTDGTLGLAAIMKAGGISVVQDPASAKFDGMPTSAIHAGNAMHVLPVEQMPNILISKPHRPPLRHELQTPSTVRGINSILKQLRTATGHDFSLYKKNTIIRRIERRMLQNSIEDMEVYANFLKESPTEVQVLFKELLINVTSFFRDPDAFILLKNDILPRLCKDKSEGYNFRVWVAGCATG
ncbi:MAG: SAM-dependent methyltransferase, partial [Pseudomonadales bacterium]|nr:SAM-dependent methyltransferase [Pseudomonadales bacterium]